MVEQEENVILTNEDEGATPMLGQRRRIQSEIEFPYADLEVASELAITLHQKAGGESDDAELAGWLNQSSTGGTYRSRRSAARMFGLIDLTQGRVCLTALGHDLNDDRKARAARTDAFLKPELYNAMYEKFRGTVLPPGVAIERMMQHLGVSPKQTDRARQAFIKSANHAGFIDASSGRFIKPSNGTSHQEAENREKGDEEKKGNGGGGNGDDKAGLSLDPLLMALLQKIPPKGEDWGAAKRLRWFKTFAMNVSQVYDKDDEVIELKIEQAPQ